MDKRQLSAWILFFVLTAGVWALTIYRRVELLALDTRILGLEGEYSALVKEEERLMAALCAPRELEECEREARQLGMSMPRREQLIPTEAVLPDTVAVSGRTEEAAAWLSEYFPLP